MEKEITPKFLMQVVDEKIIAGIEEFLNDQLDNSILKVELQYKITSSSTPSVGYGGLLIYLNTEIGAEIKYGFSLEILPITVNSNNSIEVQSNEKPFINDDNIILQLKDIIGTKSNSDSLKYKIYSKCSPVIQQFGIDTYRIVVNIKIDEKGELFIY